MKLTKEDMERGNERRAAQHDKKVEKIRRHIAEKGILTATHRLVALLYKQRMANKETTK